MPRVNDLDLKNWKKYQDLITDSLWIIPSRDNSGSHKGDYHGNFVPQIPSQLIRRFTKRGDVVLDTFLGSGTTLIESQRLGRNGIGIELVPEIAEIAKNRIKQQPPTDCKVFNEVIVGDSTKNTVKEKIINLLKKYNKNNIQFLIMHPPYHDIIKFSNKKEDLSNAKSIREFLELFGRAVDNFADILERGFHLAVVIGDKYVNSEWVPLSFYVMNEVMKRKEFMLKGVLVKNMVNNRAKRNQENLWRYRALVGGFYIFRHEYILLFRKK